jgi:ABC-type branched-subunit amino acid transport system permease subunit
VQITLFSIVQGLVAGLLYGLLALGLVLIYRTNRILNFSSGQLGVVAAVFLLKLTRDLDIPYFPSLVFVLVLGACLGALCELLLRRLFDRPRVLVMVATIGLSQVLFLLTLLPFVAPGDLFVEYPLPFHVTWHVGDGILRAGDVTILIVAPLVAVGLAAFLRYSSWGLGMRGMAENADSARLSGVWVRRMSTLAWAIAGLLSAITAVLDAPGQASALKEALPPGLLLRALAAALIAGMTSLLVAFVAGIAIGVVEQVVNFNLVGDPDKTAKITLYLFLLILVVLLVRVGTLRRSARTEERSSWALGGESGRQAVSAIRAWIGRAAVTSGLVLVAFLPVVVSPGRSFLIARVCIFAVIALSLTVLTGWAGQVSLGQFGLVAVGAIVAARLADWNLVLLLPLAGVIAALVAVLVGLPALRIRGLYLAVTTLGFALFMQVSVLSTPCFTMPIVGTEVCTGLPEQPSTLVQRPSFFGIDLTSDRAYAWFSLGVLLVFLLVVRTWRDRGIARRLIAVRDNEAAAAGMGIPVVRTKLLAFGLSGFMAGVAGACLAFALERIGPGDFAVPESVLVLSMVVIGGLGSVPGAVLGALYLVGLPAALGSTSTVQFITSGFGVLAFLLYLPGGLAELAQRAGDGLAALVERWRAPGDTPGTGGDEPDEQPALQGSVA